MRLDAGQVPLPAKVLAVDLAQVGYEEGILVANAAGVVVNGVDSALQGLPNHLLGLSSAMMDSDTKVIVSRLVSLKRQVVLLGSRQGRRCHSLDSRFQVWFRRRLFGCWSRC